MCDRLCFWAQKILIRVCLRISIETDLNFVVFPLSDNNTQNNNTELFSLYKAIRNGLLVCLLCAIKWISSHTHTHTFDRGVRCFFFCAITMILLILNNAIEGNDTWMCVGKIGKMIDFYEPRISHTTVLWLTMTLKKNSLSDLASPKYLHIYIQDTHLPIFWLMENRPPIQRFSLIFYDRFST